MKFFVYGSLMWDGWHRQFNCNDIQQADLIGYERSFNKKSTRNWGTKLDPCPTLNLVPNEKALCRGLLFCFSDENSEPALSYLRKREGKNFQIKSLDVILVSTGEVVTASVFIYEGSNLLSVHEMKNCVTMLRVAKGRDGSGEQYVAGLADRLNELSISDACVEDMRRRLGSNN